MQCAEMRTFAVPSVCNCLCAKSQRALRLRQPRMRTGDILTGGGRLEKLYNAPDFVWTEDQLPHHHKLRGDTHEVLLRVLALSP